MKSTIRFATYCETRRIKLSSVASDIMGLSGQQILRALVAGEESAERSSWKVGGKLRKKEAQLRKAVKADFSLIHRDMLELQLEHYDFLTGQVASMV